MPWTNHWPTIARLITDNALWPRPRVSVTATASDQNDCAPLIAQTTDAEARDHGGEHDSRAEAIDEAPDADRKQRSDQRRP